MSHPPPLVGREGELAALRAHLDAALGGHGSLVLVGGEAGIGKTTLAEAVCQEAIQHGALVLVGRCYDLTETPPYGPWIELFGHYHTADGRPPLPAIFAQPSLLGPITSRAAFFQEVLDFLTALATAHPVGVRPLVLLLDDLHWSDPESLDLLRVVARTLASVPILVVATYRLDELTRRHPLSQLLPMLVREASAARIDLRRIEAADIQSLVDARYALPGRDAGRLAAYLGDRSGGNPFFLSELLRTLEAERILRPSTAGWRLGDLTEIRVPPLLRQVIDVRLARLESEVQRLLATASVIGQEVSLALWATVAESDEQTLSMAVEQAMEAHLMVASRDGARVQFAHALIREALYEGALPMRRRVWHRRAGEAVMALPNPDPDAVAHHFRQAGDARAYEWLIRAGDRAQDSYAYVVAADRFEVALALLKTREATAGERGWLLRRLARLRRYENPRQGIAYLDEALQLARQVRDPILIGNVLVDRGMLLNWAGSVTPGLKDMVDGVAALQLLSAADRARFRTLPSSFQLFHEWGAEATLALQLAVAGRFPEARALGERAVHAKPSAATREASDGAALADAYFGLARAYAALGLPVRAREAFAHTRELYGAAQHHMMLGVTLLTELDRTSIPYDADRVGERRRIATEAEASYAKASAAAPDQQPQIARVPLLILEGDWETARTVIETLPQPLGAFPGLLRATIAARQGDVGLAWQLVHETLPDGPGSQPGDSDFPQSIGLQRLAATLALDAGDHSTTRQWLEMHDRWLTWSGSVLGQAEGRLLWARYHRAVIDRPRAFEQATSALAHATEPRQPLALVAAHRMLGELATDAGRHADAATYLATSLALADVCAAPYERALTLLAVAELRHAAGDAGDALALLDEVRAICTPLGAAPTLARVAALADRLGAETKRVPAYPAGLSAREVEVLGLVADGLTNAQVAERLFISPHTINAHLTTIYAKLAVPSRAAAIRFALDHGLR